jgi:ATP-binding cassette subfamily B protein IrtB
MITRLRRLLPSEQRRRYDLALALMAISGVLQGLAFVMLLPVLRGLLSDRPSDAWPAIGGLAAVTLAYIVTTWFAAERAHRVGMELTGVLHRQLGDAVVRMPLGTVDLAATGRLARLTSKGVMQIATVPAHFFRPILAAVTAPATVVIGIALIDWRIGLAVLLCLPLLALTYSVTTAVVGRCGLADADAISEASARVVEFARVQPALRAFGGSGTTGAAMRDALARQHAARRGLLIWGSVGISTFVLAVQTAVTAIIVTGLWLALDGAFDVPTLIALSVLGLRFAEPIVAVADLGSGMRVSRHSLDEITEILTVPGLPEPAIPAEPEADPPVELRDVTFGYQEGTPVLRGVSFTVPPGSTTAVVGPSGAGKSTLLKVVARFHDVSSGEVLLGGRDVRQLGTEQTMSMVSPVFQDVFLFSGTLLDNIRMGRPSAGEDEVLAAGRAAAVDEIAARLPGGWNAEVGEGGSRLSGGERQRVSIARAILKDAPILLLDEATSALDPVNERAVTRALHLLDGRTRIVVAHRLSTIESADQIVVLAPDGTVAEIGSHADLLAADGRYAAFWRTRDRARGWTLDRTGAGEPVHCTTTSWTPR